MIRSMLKMEKRKKTLALHLALFIPACPWTTSGNRKEEKESEGKAAAL